METLTTAHRQYWRKNLKISAILLAILFGVTYIVAFFARELNQIIFLGFPLAFYVGAQGALIVYVAVLLFHARRMNRLDREYGVVEEE